MSEVAIFHGTKGNPEENWFPWLAEVVRHQGYAVNILQFPTPENQSLDSWIETYKKSRVHSLGHAPIFIGHSIGATFALRLLERDLHGPRQATFLVSGLVGPIGNEEFDKLNETFYREPFDWGTIKRTAGQAFVYHGTNDPYVPMHHAETIAKGLGVEVVKINGGGHINAESGFTKFERLWQDLKPLLDRTSQNP